MHAFCLVISCIRRTERNRVHAKQGRQRKIDLISALQQFEAELKVENAKLRDQIHSISGEEETVE
jgi:hypothetical protein